MNNKIKPGDTVYFVAEHYYRLPDKAGARMEYLPVEGTVTGIIDGGYRQAKVQSVIDGVVHLHYFKTADYGRGFYASYEEALDAAKCAADKYDRTWSGIMHEKIRRPWENREEKQQ